MKNHKKMLKGFLATSMVFSYFTISNTINAEGIGSISFPVEFFDVDADGLFFEYMLGAGMDTFGFKDSNNTGPTRGLISPILGKDGNPVYTRLTIENAAQVIHDNLKDLKGDTGLNKYDVFKYFVSKSGAKGSTYENSFGNAENYFYNNGWSLNSNVNVNQSNGQIHTGSGKVIWQHEGDGVINKGYKDHLTKVVDVTSNTDYKFDYWRGNSTIKYQIKTLDGTILLDDGATNFNSKENTQVIFDIYREEDGSEEVKFSIPKLTPDGGEQGDNLIGQDGKTFITEGWQSSNYPNATKATDKLMDGTVYFEQSGDGVLCSKDSSIIFNTDIETSQVVNLRYYLGGNGCQADGMKIVVIDKEDKVLKTLDLEDTDGFHEQSVDIPKGNGNVKVKVVGKAGSRIAALTMTPLGGEFPLGDYDKTEEKYNASLLKVYQDCNTCMDYAYLRLKNFFNTDFYLNHKTDLYNKMILNGQNREVNGELKSFYSFNGGNKIKYDTTNKEFYNDNELGQDNGGFFPLDLYGNERHGDNHNYHFGMKMSGSFVYKKGANQFFNFNGDDDVYIFINGKLVVDLGGAHYAAEGDVDIEEFAKENGIRNGETCEFNMFYLERHTLASTCKIDTNLRIGHLTSYQFESEDTDLMLPESVIHLTPIDEDEHYIGEEVFIADENKKFENVEDTRDEYDGYWEFVNWDKDTITIEEEGNIFTGTWRFVLNEYNVTYQFVSGTKNKELPEAINKYLPTDSNTYIKGKIINTKEPTEKKYIDTFNDGTWVFKVWNENEKVVNGDVKFVGTWEFVANPIPVDPTPDVPTTGIFELDDELNSDVLGDKVVNKDEILNGNSKDEEDSLDSGVLGDKYSDDFKSKHVKTSDDQRIMLYSRMTVITFLGFMLIKKKKTSEE